MGEVYASFEVLNPLRPDLSVSLEGLTDTGATLCLIPSADLARIGIRRIRRVRLDLADGSIVERDLGHAAVRIGGHTAFLNVVFGDAGDPTLLGLTALESLGLAVDPVHRRLIPVDYKLMALSRGRAPARDPVHA